VSAVAGPGEDAFTEATRVFNLAAPAQPAEAVTATSVAEVRAALRHAMRAGLPVRVHSTGHASATGAPMAGALLIRTAIEGGVTIDPASGTARIPAGTPWGAVIDAAAPLGLAAPHGSSPLVGVVGYLLRGGISVYGRHTGVAANLVRAVELVTADGELRRVDGESDPELFRAVRGGGGGFGVVTAIEVGLFPVDSLITGAAYWPAAHAERILPLWLDWARTAPREVTTSLRVMRLPDLPVIPPPLRAGPVVCVDGTVLGLTADDLPTTRKYADELLGPLRAVAEPLVDSWRPAGLPDVAETHMDPVEPFPLYGDHLLLDDLGEEGAAAFLRVAGEDSGSPLINAELRQLGGALAEPAPGGGVLGHLDGALGYLGGGVPFGPVTPEAIEAHCAEVRAALRPWDTGRTVPTFVEHVGQPQGHLDAGEAARVRAVRSRVDPAGLFRGDVVPRSGAVA